MKYENLKDVISQLEMPNYQTEDGFHNLKNNSAFIQLKEFSEIHNITLANPNADVIEDLKSISNNYQVINGLYVISKNDLDVLIQHLESLSV